MAFKKGQRFLRARDPKTGRYVTAKNLQRAVQREVVEWTGRKFRFVAQQEKAARISPAEYKAEFKTRVQRQFPVAAAEHQRISVSRSRFKYIETALEKAGIFDNLISDIVRTEAGSVNFSIDLNELKLWTGKQYPDIKNIDFQYYLRTDELKGIMSKDPEQIERTLDNVRRRVMREIKGDLKEKGVAFSARKDRSKENEDLLSLRDFDVDLEYEIRDI